MYNFFMCSRTLFLKIFMKITIKDIAKLAGVSRGTVDRALNDRGKIDPEKKRKILEIAEQNGYVKNIFASNLAHNTAIPVVIVLPNPKSDPFWQAPRLGIKKTINLAKSYGITIKSYDFDLFDKQSFCSSLDRAINDKPKAILTAPVYYKEFRRYLQIAQQNSIPFVCINSEIKDPDILCYIGQNSYQCGQLAGKLFDLTIGSKKKIAVITLGHDLKNAIHIEEKIKGLHDFNQENNCQSQILNFQIKEFDDVDNLTRFAHQILSEHSDIEGMFFTNSRAYRLINDVPEFKKFVNQITVIGFDLISQNIELLKSNSIDFLLNQDPARQGYLGMINILNYFVYNKHIETKQYLPVDVVVKENYENYLTELNNELEMAL